MKNYSHMQGATLVIALILLLLLTLIGITAMRTGVFEGRMSGNVKDSGLAFQSAESALSAGESWLMAQTIQPTPTSNCAAAPKPCVFVGDPTRYPATQALSWWQSNGQSATLPTGVKTAPIYVIEFSRFVPDDKTVGYGYVQPGLYYYRITSWGTGATDQAIIVLQSTIARRF